MGLPEDWAGRHEERGSAERDDFLVLGRAVAPNDVDRVNR